MPRRTTPMPQRSTLRPPRGPIALPRGPVMPRRRPMLTLATGLAAALTVAVMGAALAFSAPLMTADANDVPDAITSLRFVAPNPADPSAPLRVGQQFRMDATWSVPDSAQPGDTFSLTFPSPVSGNSSTFVMNDPAGDDVGTCVVSSNNFTCTLSDYVLTHSAVQGTLYFYATVTGSYDELIFQTSWNSTFRLDVPPYDPNPGPGPDPNPGPVPPPSQIEKTVGNAGAQGQRWVVKVVGSQLRFNGADVVLTDTYDPNIIINFADFAVQRYDAALFGTSPPFTSLTEGSGPDTYTLVRDAGPNSFQLTIHDALPDQLYTIWYGSSVRPGTPNGTVLVNTIEGRGSSSAQWVHTGAGGDGSGQQGSLAVTKVTAGGGTPPTGTFPIRVSCTRNGAEVSGYPRDAAVAAGSSVTFDGIPLGAQCTVTETDTRGAESTTYSQRTVTVSSATEPVVVTVTNTYEAAPTGALTVTKRTAGTGSVPAGPFPIRVECSHDGSAVAGYPRDAQILADETASFTGLPIGAVCTITETDSRGATSVGYSAQTVTITDDATAVSVTITNTYQPRTGSLAVTKRVDGDGPAPSGTFPITVICGQDDAMFPGFPRVLDILAGRTATIENIPVGARCSITESDSRGATRVGYSAQLVTITDAVTPVEVTVTNTYLAPRGALVVTKKVAGDGTAPSGTFPIEVECTQGATTVAGLPYRGQVAARESIELDNIPVGATCTITETDSRGASSVRYSQQTVTITQAATPVTVTVTNTYTAPPAGLALTGRSFGLGLGVLATAQAAFLLGALLILLSSRRRSRA